MTVAGLPYTNGGPPATISNSARGSGSGTLRDAFGGELSIRHSGEIAASGIDVNVARVRGYRTITNASALTVLGFAGLPAPGSRVAHPDQDTRAALYSRF
jgi:hypothetical protein